MIIRNWKLCVINFFPYRLGDQISSVNGVSLLNVTHADAVKILKESGSIIELVCNISLPVLTFSIHNIGYPTQK